MVDDVVVESVVLVTVVESEVLVAVVESVVLVTVLESVVLLAVVVESYFGKYFKKCIVILELRMWIHTKY